MCKLMENETSAQDDLRRKTFVKYSYVKQFFDVLISIIVMPFIIIVILITSIFIRIESKGSAIYTQKRIGKNGKEFTIYKLRSMRVDAEELTGSVWAEKDDPRVTKVGRIIRKYRIDELPQFFNIIKGDMSLIGPRPERKDLTERFSKEIPNFKIRLRVKPGITGLAQVNGGYDIDPAEKLKWDILYIDNFSLLSDIKIALLTIKVIFTGDGAR